MSEDPARFEGLSSLIAFAGVNIPARARFVTRFVASTLYTSLTLGLVAGQAGALMSCGPLVPFMTGSWLGYTWGCVGFWRQAKKSAMTCARRHPSIMSHALLTEFDIEVPTHVVIDKTEEKDTKGITTLEEWITQGGMSRLSYAVLAAQSCQEDILELQKNQRQKLIEDGSIN
jgi:hypothetical protein